MRKPISWRGLNKFIRLAKKWKKNGRYLVIRHEGVKIFSFYLFVWFKKPVSKVKTTFVFRLFDLAIRFYSACFIHDINKLENRD